MGTQRVLDIYDHASGGKVRKEIAGWVSQGHTNQEIAFRLREKGIRVDPSTVRRFVMDGPAK